MIPYAWFATQINAYMHEEKPENFEFMTYSKLWILAISSLFFFILKRSICRLRPLILRLIPTKKEDGSSDVT